MLCLIILYLLYLKKDTHFIGYYILMPLCVIELGVEVCILICYFFGV
jgi:hypothetical protein